MNGSMMVLKTLAENGSCTLPFRSHLRESRGESHAMDGLATFGGRRQ